MQIIVLGMHRSGTSLTARMVNMMGAYFGPEGSSQGFTRDNPKGFWERKDVMRLNNALMQLQNCNWKQLSGWDFGMASMPDTQRQALQSLILDLDAYRPWMLKDPRLCLTLPYWKPLLEVPVCVIVHRDPLEIAESLLTRDAIPIERGIALWECYAVGLLKASADLPHVFVSHTDFLANPISVTAQLYHGLVEHGIQGLRLPSEREILAFIDKALYRSKPAESQRQIYRLSTHQEQLSAMLLGKAWPQGNLGISEASLTLLKQPLPLAS